MRWWSRVIAAGFAVGLSGYSVSAGNDGHVFVQVGLIWAGTVLVYEVAVDLLDRLPWQLSRRSR